MGAFDDLIPSSQPGTVAPSRGYFRDLIPETPAEPETVGQVRGFFGALQRGVKAIVDLPDTIALTNRSGLDDSGIAQYRAHRIGQLTGESGPEVIYRTQQAAAERVAQNVAENQAMPRSEAQRRLESADGWRGKFSAWLKDPVELTASIAAESLPASVAGALGGAAVGGPVGAVAGVGLSSGLMTFSNELLGNASARGVDLRNPDALSDWLRSDAYDKDASSALTKAVTVGAIDAGTAGMAGRFVVPALKTGLLRNVAIASGKELALQAGAGAGGEALGSLAAGQKVDPFNVFAEAIAEVASGPAEVASNFRSRSHGLRSRYRAPDVPPSEPILQPNEPQERPAVQVPVQPVPTVTAPQAVEATPVVREEAPVKGGERFEERQERPQEVLVESGAASVAPVSRPPESGKVVITSDQLRDELNKRGGDLSAADAVVLINPARDALSKNQRVTFFDTDGKPHNITSISAGMLVDDKGQRWGSLPFATDKSGKSKLEITQAVTQPPVNATPERSSISRPVSGTGDRSVEGAVEKPAVGAAETAEQIASKLNPEVMFKGALTPDLNAEFVKFRNEFVVPVVRKLQENGWSSIEELETARQRRSTERSMASEAAANLVQGKLAEVAWDSTGNPHYGLTGTPLPEWLSKSSTPPIVQKPNAKAIQSAARSGVGETPAATKVSGATSEGSQKHGGRVADAKTQPTTVSSPGTGSKTESVAFQKGDQVIAEDYGKGVVHAVLPNGRISIKFDDGKPIGVASKRVRKVEDDPPVIGTLPTQSEVTKAVSGRELQTQETKSEPIPVDPSLPFWQKGARYRWTPKTPEIARRWPVMEGYLQSTDSPTKHAAGSGKKNTLQLITDDGRASNIVWLEDGEIIKLSAPSSAADKAIASAVDFGAEIIDRGVGEYVSGRRDIDADFNEFKARWKWRGKNPNDTYGEYKREYNQSKGRPVPTSTDSAVKQAIANAKKNGPTPEFRALFGGIDPELAGTTAEKVSKFATSIGLEYRRVPSAEREKTPVERVKVGKSPQPYTVLERLPASEIERQNGEQPVRVRNEKTGEESVVLEAQLTAIKEKTPEAQPVSGRTAGSSKQPANTPANAQAKMQAEVSSVAKTEGSRPAKEIKSELVQRLEEARDKAPDVDYSQYLIPKVGEWTNGRGGKRQSVDRRNVPLSTVIANPTAWKAKLHEVESWKRAASKAQSESTVTIRIPGDGTFVVPNIKPALQEVIDRAQSLDTRATDNTRPSRKIEGTKEDDFARFTEDEWQDPAIVQRLEKLLEKETNPDQRGLFIEALKQARQLHEPPKGSAESSVASGGEGSSVGASNEVSAQTEEDPEAGKRSQVSGASMEEGAAQSGTVLWASPDEIRQVLAAERRRGENNQPEGDGIRAGTTEVRAGSEQASRGVPSGTRFFVEENETNENPQAKRAIEFLTNRIRRGAGDTESQPAKDAADFNRALAAKLSDLKIFFLALGDKAAPANATGDRLVINTSIFQRLDPENAEAVAYTDAVLAEELLHAATFRLSSSDDIINVWRSLSGLEQGLVKQAYQRIDVSDFLGGSEYIRMILQERLRGEITEQHDYRNTVTDFLKSELRKLVNFLKRIFGAKPENDIARQIIERIEAAIRGEPPIPGSVFNATPPVESGTRSVAETLLTADREAAGEDYIPTEVFGIRDGVLGKTQYTDAARAKSLGIAEAAFEEAGLEVTREADGHYQLVPTEKPQNEAGRQLVDIVKREIEKYGQGALELTELVQSLVLDFKTGRMDKLFNQNIRNKLYSLAQGERSFRGVSLNALRGAMEDIKFVAQNIDVHLQRIWRESYGGEQIDAVLAKIREKFKAFFTPEVVSQVVKENPALAKVKDAEKLIKDGLEAEWTSLKELQDKYRDDLIKAGVDAKSAPGLAKQIVDALRPQVRMAGEQAAKEVEGQLVPDELTAVKGKKPIWQKIVDAVKRGDFDDAPLLQEKAKQNGWQPPSEDQIARIKRLAERERQLHELSKKERDAAKGDADKLRREQIVRDEATLPQRLPLMRQMEAAWAGIIKPVNFGRGLVKNRANNAAFINELVSANLLLRLSFAPKQALSILSQFMVHLPTRAIAQAIALHAQNRTLESDVNLRKDIYNSLAGGFKAALAGYKDGVAQFIAALRGRGEARNVDRLLSGIAAIERIDAQANQYAEQGRHGLAILFKLMSFIRLGYRIAQAFDNLHGVPSEYIEMRHQAVMELMRNGMDRSAANAQADNIITSIKKNHIFAMQEAKAFLDAQGEPYTSEKLREISYRIARRWAYEDMRALKLPADDFAAENRSLRETIGWNEREAGTSSLGGAVGGAVTLTSKAFEKMGIPLSLGRFGNAIAIGVNRGLHFTPMGFFPGAFGENNAWFRTELDRNQRKMEAAVGTTLGSLAFMLALSGVFVVRLRWPEDKEERDLFEAQGHRPGTLEIPHADGSFTAVSMNTGLAAFLAPYLAAGGALRDKLDERAKAQEKLNAEAAKKGLPPEEIRPMSVADLAGVAAQAGYQTVLGGRTSAGVVSALSDYGNLNVTKALASQTAPLIPTLPALQELSRMGGVVLDSKLASFSDFLLPLPSSPARRVNFLGEPSGTPDDMQRIVQVLTGGSYPNVDPEQAKAMKPYQVLFASGFRPPSVEPNKGYPIGDSFRPFNDAELERYAILRGQEFRNALQGLSLDADATTVRRAYRSANERALGALGVRSARKTTGRRTRRRSGLRSRRSGLRSLRAKRSTLRSRFAYV